jgi:Ca2+-binding RTX toxin-like protein
LRGGEGGSDWLSGEAGNDIYLWGVGEGNTTIDNYEYYSNRYTDTVKLLDGTTPSNVRVSNDIRHIYLTLTDTNEYLVIHYSRMYDSRRIDLVEFNDGTTWPIEKVMELSLQATPGNDVIYGYETDDYLSGLDGTDTLYGASGNDTLVGGPGSGDYLKGDSGNDKYLWTKGHGNTTIDDYDTSSITTGILEFGEGVLPTDISVKNDTSNLYLTVGSNREIITIKGFTKSVHSQIDSVQFSGGEIWSKEDLKRLSMIGTDLDDVINGYSTDDNISGGLGNDKLYGGGGNDTISGGEGNDYLKGGPGSDIYLWSIKDGDTTIDDYDTSNVAINVLVMGEGVIPSDLTVTTNTVHLFLFHVPSGKRITITNFTSSENYQISEIRFHDGTVWDTLALKNMAMTPTDGNDVLVGYSTDDTIVGLSGIDNIYGQGGNDILRGGPDGLDYIAGGRGIDTYLWGPGDGNLKVNADTYYVDTERDRFRFLEGVSPSDVKVTNSNYHIYFNILPTGNYVEIYLFRATSRRLDNVTFADGTVWDTAKIMELAMQGTDGDDVIYGYEDNDVINGLGGSDKIYGGEGDDTLNGGPGGNTFMKGESGNDTYLWNLGEGGARIDDYATDSGNTTDVLRFGEGITPDQVTLRVGTSDDVIITVGDTYIYLENFLIDARYQITRVEFTGGTVWDANYIIENLYESAQ